MSYMESRVREVMHWENYQLRPNLCTEQLGDEFETKVEVDIYFSVTMPLWWFLNTSMHGIVAGEEMPNLYALNK